MLHRAEGALWKRRWDFLTKFLSCDETWVHYYEPKSTAKHGVEAHPLQEKVQKSSLSWKSHVDFVWDVKGWVSFVKNDYREDQRTINSQYYSDVLLNKVKPAMREKCCRSQRRGGVILQQDNSYCSIYL